MRERPIVAPVRIEAAFARADQLLSSKALAWGILALGLILRALEYLPNPALYIDEAALALNITDRSFAGLAQPLDYNQGAPIGFLMLERVAVLAFGTSEYALRLIPFLSSLVALYLFYEVARRLLSPRIVSIILIFFATSKFLLYYAAQVKQYSTDVAIALTLLLCGVILYPKEINARSASLLGIVGAVSVWLSHPAVFVLAAIGATLALDALLKKKWRRLGLLSLGAVLWLLSFSASYLISLRGLSGSSYLQIFWSARGAFLPLPPRSAQQGAELIEGLVRAFEDPLGLTLPVVASLLFLLGCGILMAKKKAMEAMTVVPILFVIAASSMHKYPFRDRLLLFLIPSLLIPIAVALQYITQHKNSYTPAMGWALVGLLLLYPADARQHRSIERRSDQDLRPALRYVMDHRLPGDLIYIYHHQKESFLYYARRFHIGDDEYVMGREVEKEWKPDQDGATYVADLNQLRGRYRVWALFSHVRGRNNAEERYYVEYLDELGKRLDEFRSGKSSVYLYNLSGPENR